MSKIKVEAITLNGSNEYMGGKIYYCNFSPNFSEKPTELQINVINENGNYQTPTINYNSPVKVKIGSLDLGDMYPYKYKNRYSSQGNILEISLIDPSFVLDKIFIGLNGKHGWINKFAKSMQDMSKKTFSEYLDSINSSSSSSSASSSSNDKGSDVFEKLTDNFWLIGRQFHPCDENKDNIIDFDEAFNVDPCDPCPSCPEDKYENRCQELAYTTIFEIGYSFKDLASAFQAFKPRQGSTEINIEIPAGISGNKDKYEKFYRDFFGPLREVLTSWANEFGLNWFYDIKNKTVRFIDISTKEIQVPVNTILSYYKNDKLISYEHEVSSEKTVQRGAISWYERGGERKSFDCSKATTTILSALYGADYLGNRGRTLLNGKEVNSNCDVVGSILRGYNPLLRDLFWLRTMYGMRSSKDMIQYISDFSVTANSSSSSSSGDEEEYVLANNKVIPEYGDMQILAVIDCNLSKSEKEKTIFQKIANLNYSDLILQMNELDAIKLVNNSGFFVVAYIDEIALEKRYEMEDELFDFLGKFYARENLFRLCGLTGNEEFVKNNTNIESADGSAQIYSKRDGIGSHPLSKYKFYKSGYLGCIVNDGNVSKINPATPGKKLPSSTQGFGLTLSRINNQDVVSSSDTPQDYVNAAGGAGSLFSNKKSNETIPRFEQTAIILDREPKWVPEPQTFQENFNQKISDKYGELEWKLFGSNGIPPNSTWMTSAYGGNTGFIKDGTAGKIKVFIVQTGGFKVTPSSPQQFESTVEHPTDKTANQTKKMLRRVGGKYSSETAIGLLNNKCHKITIEDGKELPIIYTPPHTLVPKATKNLIEKDVLKQTESRGDKATSCDTALKSEKFRVPAYRVYVSQSFNQSVTLPKIQTGVYTDMSCAQGVRSLDVVYTKFTNDDFKSFTGSNGYGCIPNMKYLNDLHVAYTGNVFSNIDPDDSLSLEIKGLPRISDYQSEILNGLENISIQITDQGVNTNLQYGTKLVKGISPDLLKFQNSRRFDRQAKGV